MLWPPSPSRHGPRALAIAIFTALIFVDARAASLPAPSAPTSGRRLQLEVFLNHKRTGVIGGFEQLPDGRMSARRSGLIDIGVKPPGDGGPDVTVILENVPGLSYRYDEPKQTIDIAIPDSLRADHEYHASGGNGGKLGLRSSYGATLGYDLFASSDSPDRRLRPDFQGVSVTLDLRAFSPYGTLTQTGIVSSTPETPNKELRLDTTYSYSNPDTLDTYDAGDVISSGLAWTRPIRIAGAQAQRNFTIRPDLVTLPLPYVSGNAAVPSTLDVYVNNIKTYSQDVPEGPYRVMDLPVTGQGTAHIVLRDSSGHLIEQDAPFFASRLQLRPGLTDYSVEVGLPRRNYGTYSDDYETRPVGSASLRRGVYDWLTVEAHTEDAQNLANAGAGAVVRVLDRGVVSGAVTGSLSSRGGGEQIYGSFETQFRGFSLNLATQRTFGAYDDLASVTASLPSATAYGQSVASYGGLTSFGFAISARPPKELERIAVSAPLVFDKSSLSASVAWMRNADDSKQLIGTVGWSRNIWFDASLFVNAYSSLGSPRQSGVMVGLTVPLGNRVVASSGATVGHNHDFVTTDVSKAQDVEIGSYGWRVRDSEGDQSDRLRQVSGSYRTPYARVAAGATQVGSSATGTFEADGSIATLGNGVFFSNRIDDAFAVVDAGSPNVDVYHDNRLIGQTDSSGRLLVPYLRSYQNNQLSLDTTNLPVNADVATTKDVVVPAFRSGVRVDFGVRTVSDSAVVILTDAEGKNLKAGLKGEVEGSGGQFVVGYDGRAFIKGLAAANRVRVALGVGECHAEFGFQPAESRQVVIGPVVCR